MSAYSNTNFSAKRQAVSLPYWLRWFFVLLFLLVPLCVYGVLPALGFSKLASFLDLKKLVLLFLAGVSVTVYLYYYQYLIKRPQILLIFMMAVWSLVEFLSELLLGVGLNLHLRPLLMMGIALPSAVWLLKYRKSTFRELPWFRYYAFFIGWLILYAVFYNANAADPSLSGGEASVLKTSASFAQLNSYINCFLAMPVAFICMFYVTHYKSVFDTLNKFVLVFSGLEAIMTIAGYPFGLMSMTLDGFLRALGIFTHPNPYAHHMGILMVYLFGLLCYYMGENGHKGQPKRISRALLFTSIALNFTAFLLGLSKTAIFALGVSGTLLFLMNMGVSNIRRYLPHVLIGFSVIVLLGMFGFETLSGKSFLNIIESRIQQTESMDWRTQVWDALLGDINLKTIWFGHGLTAANMAVYHATYSDAHNAKPLMMVHNAYIALLYDLGIMGYTMFLSIAVMFFANLKKWKNAVISKHKTPYSVVIALIVYYIIVCSFDEIAYMFDSALLFWLMTSLWFSLGQRERQEDEFHYQRRLEALGSYSGEGIDE